MKKSSLKKTSMKESQMKESQTQVRFDYSSSTKKGWTKIVGTLVESENGIFFDPLQKELTDYLVFKYNIPDEDEYDPVRIYNELKKYQELSKKGYAPAIVHCYSSSENKGGTFDEFIDHYHKDPSKIPSDTNYIIEKLNCDEDLFNIFKTPINSIRSYISSYFYANRDYQKLFSELAELLRVLATPKKGIPGLFLVDMKSGNICSDDTGKLKLIDFDPSRLFILHNRDYATPAITFMLFQTYLIFYIKNRDITFDVTGISKSDYDDMLNFIYDIEESEEGDELFYLRGDPSVRESISPLKSLSSYYFRIQGLPSGEATRRYKEDVLTNRNFYDQTIRSGFFGFGKRKRGTKGKKNKKSKKTKRVKKE
jgi:hypothetical protein